MIKTLFFLTAQIGEVYITKSFIDAWCAHRNCSKASMVLVLKRNCREVFDIVFAAEGYQVYYWDPGDDAQADQALAQYIVEGHFSSLVHVGSSIVQNWLGRLWTISKECGIAERIYAEVVFGNADVRSRARHNAQWAVENGFYTRTAYIEIYDEANSTNRHYLESLQRALEALVSGPVQLELPSVNLAPSSCTLPSYVMCNIGAGEVGKKYPSDQFAKAIGRLLQANLDVTITGGGAADAEDQRRILQLLRFSGADMNRVHPLVGKTSLISDIHMAHHAEFVITNDTGVANLVHGMGGRQIVLVWSAVSGSYFPYPQPYSKSTTRCLWTVFDCPQCNTGSGYGCKFAYTGSYPCLAAISPDDILAVVHDWIPEV